MDPIAFAQYAGFVVAALILIWGIIIVSTRYYPKRKKISTGEALDTWVRLDSTRVDAKTDGGMMGVWTPTMPPSAESLNAKPYPGPLIRLNIAAETISIRAACGRQKLCQQLDRQRSQQRR